MRNTVHKYDTVIVGSSLEALTYAYITKYPVFFAGLKCPFEFEHFRPDFYFPNEDSIIRTINSNIGKIEFGINKLDLWNKLLFCLSFAGQVPITGEANSLRIDNGTLRINSNNKIIVVEPQKILLFDDYNIQGLGAAKNTVGHYTSYDYVEFNSMYPHEYEYIKDNDSNLISEIWFVNPPTDKRYKDGFLISTFKKKKELETDLAEYNIKFRLKDIFKKYGLKGKANGFHHIHKHIQRYKQVRYTLKERIIIEPKNVYEDIDNIIYMPYDVESIMKDYRPNPQVDRLWKLSKIT